MDNKVDKDMQVDNKVDKDKVDKDMQVDKQVDKDMDKEVDKEVDTQGQEMEERMKVATSAEKIVVFQKAIAGWSKPSGEIRISVHGYSLTFFKTETVKLSFVFHFKKYLEPRQLLRGWRRGGLKCQSVWSRWSLRRFFLFYLLFCIFNLY